MGKELKLNLPKADDLFTTQEERDDANSEKILIVSAEEVYPYERQPYSVKRLSSDLIRLMDSIGRYGIQEPLIVRNRAAGGYEIISGHRRDYCGQAHSIPDRPIIIRSYTDDEADILVADFNIAREKILPSELAKAYKLRYDAMKRQGKRTDLTLGDNPQKLEKVNSRKELANIVGMTEDKVRCYLNLNKLLPGILGMVDREEIALSPASELSSLTTEQQVYLFQLMNSDECTPSNSQAIKMRKLSDEGQLSEDDILSILSERKPNQVEQFKIPRERLKRFFSIDTPSQQIEETIIKALEFYKQRERSREAR